MKFMRPVWSWLRVRTPRPPYDQQDYWDKVYMDTRGRYLEWAEMSVGELIRYQWSDADSDFFMRQKKDGALEEHIGKDDKVIVLGCGNSMLGEDLRIAGWRGNITSVDFAVESVETVRMRSAMRGLPDMDFITADVRELHQHIPAGSMDVALDKGLLDAIYCSAKSDKAVQETKGAVLRLLKPGGRWFAIMNGGFFGAVPPIEIRPLMEDDRWKSLEIRRLAPISLGLYLHIWTKGGNKQDNTKSKRGG